MAPGGRRRLLPRQEPREPKSASVAASPVPGPRGRRLQVPVDPSSVHERQRRRDLPEKRSATARTGGRARAPVEPMNCRSPPPRYSSTSRLLAALLDAEQRTMFTWFMRMRLIPGPDQAVPVARQGGHGCAWPARPVRRHRCAPCRRPAAQLAAEGERPLSAGEVRLLLRQQRRQGAEPPF